jgi:hypothetical protein
MKARNTTQGITVEDMQAAATAREATYPEVLTDDQLKHLQQDANIYNDTKYSMMMSAKPTREQVAYGCRLILKGEPNLGIADKSMAVKAMWVRHAVKQAETDPEIQKMFDGWKAAYALTHAGEPKLEDAWQVATVYQSFQARWIDVEESPPEEGQKVLFCYGEMAKPEDFKYGAGKYTNGQYYDDLQNTSGAGIKNVVCWKDLAIPVLQGIVG